MSVIERLYPCRYIVSKVYGFIENRCASVGVEMFTSLVDPMYDHWVFPLNQMVICGVDATNFVPFTDIVPEVLPTAPGLDSAKRAVMPPRLDTMAVALSRQALAWLEFCARILFAAKRTDSNKKYLICFIVMMFTLFCSLPFWSARGRMNGVLHPFVDRL